MLTMPKMGARALIATLPVFLRREDELAAWRGYVAEGIRAISENTAKAVKEGKYLPKSWTDIVARKPADKRTNEEKAADILKNAGIKVVTRK